MCYLQDGNLAFNFGFDRSRTRGKQLRQIALSAHGEGAELITGSQLSPDIYLYALIVDGKEIDVKRMILTEEKL